MMGAPLRGQRDVLIDLMRGISAMAVALFHFNEVPTSTNPSDVVIYWRAIWKFGHLGVPVFFVLSGYCIGQAWLKSSGARPFMRRRLLRIVPAYWASLVIMLAVVGGTWVVTGVNDVVPLPRGITAIIATMTLTTDPVTGVKAINWVYWSLSYEIAFYAIMTLALIPNASNRIRALVTTHLVLCTLSAAIVLVTPSPWFFIRLWPLFGLGLGVRLAKDYRIASSVVLAGCVAATLGSSFRHELIQYFSVAWLAAGLIWKAPSVSGHLARAIAWVGKSSYSLFLIHVPIGVFLLMRLIAMPADQPVLYFLGQLTVLIGCLLVARVSFGMFEQPFLGKTKYTNSFVSPIPPRRETRERGQGRTPKIDE